MFKPGHEYRWRPGQSGNPTGIPRSRREFETAFYSALVGEGSPEEAVRLLWAWARNKEPWVVQLLLQRLAPQENKLKLELSHDDGFDPTRLSDAEIEQLTSLLELASGERPEVAGGEMQAE